LTGKGREGEEQMLTGGGAACVYAIREEIETQYPERSKVPRKVEKKRGGGSKSMGVYSDGRTYCGKKRKRVDG